MRREDQLLWDVDCIPCASADRQFCIEDDPHRTLWRQVATSTAVLHPTGRGGGSRVTTGQPMHRFAAPLGPRPELRCDKGLLTGVAFVVHEDVVDEEISMINNTKLTDTQWPL